MCDTLVATGDATADGTVMLAKNSDRHPNEAHVLEHVPPARHAPGATVRCTYVEIPQVVETHEVLLSRPFWTWGCEMGMNGCGVAMGNEAVFTAGCFERARQATARWTEKVTRAPVQHRPSLLFSWAWNRLGWS